MERLPKDTEDNGLSKAFLALAKRAAYQSLEDFYITLEDTFVNEDTGEESSTKYDIGLFAKSVPDATKKAEEYCKQGLTDLSIVSVKRTKWIDIL